MSIHKSIAKSTSIISFATLCSRILGFARDVVIARLFGVYVYAQAFVIAFRIPNLFRDFVGEGATNAAFVPVFSEYATQHTQVEFWELVNVVLNLLLTILMAITVMGIIMSPIIVRFIAPGFIFDPYKLETTVRLNRIIFPYILLISLAAYSTAILNSLGHFTVCAFSPCLLNISLIVFALLFGEGIKGLALGVLIGGVLQLAVQLPVLYKKGFRLKFPRQLRHPAAETLGRLMLPRVLSSSIYQLNNFVDSIFGSLKIVGEGGVAVLYFSYRLIQFPLGIFSTALTQAILPTLSLQVINDQQDKLERTLSFGLRATFLMMLPASLGLMVLARPIVSTLFRGGKFDIYSTELTAQALFFYSIGLFAYGGTKVLHSCLFALRDTLTPAKVSFLSLVINIILNSILMFPLKINGLALATSISGIISFLILFFILKRRLRGFNLRVIIDSFLRIFLASLAMAVVSYFFCQHSLFLGSNKLLSRAVNLGWLVFLSIIAYIIFCFIFRVREMGDLWQWLKQRIKNGRIN